MMENGPLSKEYVAERLKDLLADELTESPLKWDYCKAAAVQSYFDMNSIRPLGGRQYDKREALESLLTESTITYDETHQPRWTLRPDVRRKALTQLIQEQGLQRALESNLDRPRDPLQKMFEDYVFERAPALDVQDGRQLRDTLQVADWLHGLVAGVPSSEEVRQRLDMEGLLASFRYLVGNHFRGRDKELKQLSRYVGVADPGSVSESIKRVIEQVFSIKDKPPLVIYGPGGMGKSTLLARFIMLHVNLDESRRFPFVYLDFDRTSLTAEEPVTLLLEAVGQLGIQYPESKVSLEKTREKWMARLKSQSAGAHPSGPDQRISDFRVRNRNLFLDEFAEEVKYLSLAEQPLLLVLDTFEEVQCRNKALVGEVFNFLEELQARVPRLRTVLAGRAPVELEGFAPLNVPLEGFDPEAAQGFLMSNGLNDEKLAAKVVSSVGGSPLTLRMASELLLRTDVQAESFDVWAQLREEVVQAQLYQRILEHITDEEVRKLAHPGLVLRRITPELILDVLAKPCGITVPDIDTARDLFRKLAQDVSLVEQAEGEVLIHRPELRVVMRQLLCEVAPEQVNEIHRGAVRFYEKRHDSVSRAEEIYHRLALGIEREVLDARWQDGLEPYLAPAIHELPLQSQAFLAARMDLEVNDEVWLDADQIDWELYAMRRSRSLLDLGQAEQALAIIYGRKELMPASRLLPLEVEALMRLNRFKDAQLIVEPALAQTDFTRNSEEFLRLSLYGAELDEQLGVTRDPALITDRFAQLEQMFGSDIRLVTLGLRYLRQYRSVPEAQRLRKIVQSIIKDIPRNVLSQYPRLMREVAALFESDEELEALRGDGEFVRGEKSVATINDSIDRNITSLHQLPPPPMDFTGREDELKQLLAQANQGSIVITGIRGLGGIGKTALALKLAEQLTPRHPDAQFYLDMKGTSKEPLTVEEALAHVIRAYHPTSKLPTEKAELEALYRSVLDAQRALLLFDNVAGREQIESLIPPAGCMMLVTSRKAFNLPGQVMENLNTLPPADSRHLLLTIAPRIGEYADAIARMCGHLPLGLRLAASVLAERIDLSASEYVRRLSDAQRRREFVEASLELSYDLLGPEAQKQWCKLSVFPGTFDAAAAAAIWGLESESAQDSLSNLLVYSMVQWNSATARYQLHDLLRLLADARLSASERQEIQFLHAAHYLSVMQKADKLFINGGEELKAGIALFELEWNNIQTGHAWAQKHASDEAAALACEYPIAGTFLLDLRQHPRERVQWFEAALRAARRLNDQVAEGKHLNYLGVAYQDMGELHRAIDFYKQALLTARAVNDRRMEGSALGNMASALQAMGDTRQAIDFNEQRLLLAREGGHRRGEGYALGSLGIDYAELGQLQRSIEYLEQALTIFRELGDRRSEGISLVNLGNVYNELEDSYRSNEFFQLALSIFREIGDRRGEGQALASLGLGYAAVGDALRAIEFHMMALDIARDLNDRRSEGAILGNLGLAYQNLGDFPKALEFYEQQLAISSGIGDRRGEANALWNKSVTLDRLHERGQAIAHAEAALKIYEQVEDPYASKVREQLAQWRT